MSVHYIVTLRDSFSGPRYDNVKDILFEIKMRTISMHAWAAISHYLEYKGEWDVPVHLKKSLNALSGLFYVADGKFERFYLESLKSRREAAIDNPEEINLDTISQLLSDMYPNRPRVESGLTSDLVQKVKEAGYSRISSVKNDLRKASEAFEQFERDQARGRVVPEFSGLAAARVSLNIANKTFYEVDKGPKFDSKTDPYPKIAKW
jgi:putative GTP pyrophosphokinase